MNMEKYIAWCQENGHEPGTRESRKAFEDAHSGGGKTGRKNRARKVDVYCFGITDSGSLELFTFATGVNVRDRKVKAEVLVWQATTEGGYSAAKCVIGTELELSEDE